MMTVIVSFERHVNGTKGAASDRETMAAGLVHSASTAETRWS